MNAGVVVNAVDRFLRVHPFVEHDSQALFCLVKAAHYTKEFIDHSAEDLRIMSIALVDPVEKRQVCEPVSQQRQPDLAEMVPVGLVVTSLTEF